MRLWMKAGGLLAVGLFMAVVGYPMLHETGHMLAALISGGKVVKFLVYPQPGVLCEVSRVSEAGIVLISLGGMLLPLLFAMLPIYKRFWLWYAGFVLRGICLLSFVLSAVASVAFAMGVPIAEDDVTRVLERFPDGVWLLCATFAAASVLTVFFMIQSRPLRQITCYFDL